MTARPFLLLVTTLNLFFGQSRAKDCFQDGNELKAAILEFMAAECSDSNPCDNAITQKYGYPMGTWCVSSVTSMNELFDYSRVMFNDFFNDDISAWDVSSVTDMSGLFNKAAVFNQDLSSWDVSSVTNMAGMFAYAFAFNQDLSGKKKIETMDCKNIPITHQTFMTTLQVGMFLLLLQ